MGSPLIFEPMPRYYPNTRFSDCWTSVGNVTFYHRDGKCFWRSRSSLAFAGTPAQLSALEVHRRALAAWRSLDHGTQLEWNGCAVPVGSRRPPFGTPGGISGHNLFVSAYHGFCTLGREHVPVPAPYGPFPDFRLSFLSSGKCGETGLAVRCRLELSGCADPGRYAVLGKVQLARAGTGCNPGRMRNVLGVDCAGDGGPQGTVVFVIGDCTAFAGFAADRYTMHMRYMLIDRVTGYRCLYRKLSVTFSHI